MGVSQVYIANRALQKCGSSARISALTDNSKEAKAIRACYLSLKEAELRVNEWLFAIKRASVDRTDFGQDDDGNDIAATFNRQNAYNLPDDFLRMAPEDPKQKHSGNDWLIEGRVIYTDDDGPLKFRYVSNNVGEEMWDAMFGEVLAARIAFEICEEIAQSTTKKDDIKADYGVQLQTARGANAIASQPVEQDVDEWELVRL